MKFKQYINRFYKQIIVITIAVIILSGAFGALYGLSYNYFNYVSDEMYKETTGHLEEVYSQINARFAEHIKSNWNSLSDWIPSLNTAPENTAEFIKAQSEHYGFSTFYFLSSEEGVGENNISGNKCIAFNKSGITNDSILDLVYTKDDLFNKKQNIVTSKKPDAIDYVTIFAIPLEKSYFYGDFEYSAVAVSYTSKELAAALEINAYDNKSEFYIVAGDGRTILTSLHERAGIINCFDFFKDITEKSPQGQRFTDDTFNDIRETCKSDKSKIFAFTELDKIKGQYIEKYAYFQGVGYNDMILIGVVPVSVASATLTDIRNATVDIAVKCFIIISTLILGVLVYKYVRANQRSTQEIKFRDVMFKSLSVSINDIFVMVDGNTMRPDFISVNVERLLGISHKAAIKNPQLLLDSVADKENVITAAEIANIPPSGNKRIEREHINMATGERRWFCDTIYRETIMGKSKFIIVMSDRTEEREMHQRVQHALEAAKSANEAKSHFLSNMSHDIRTPMNAIVGFSVLLAKDANNPEKVKEYTRKISASGQHLLCLINDVLDMSKIESGKTSLIIGEFALPTMLEELYTILLPQAHAKSQDFEIRTVGRLAEKILGDKLHLNQILLNLLSNAIKYTPIGGKIDFTVQNLPQTSPQYARLRFIVKDNGYGMSQEFIKKIFDPFSREITSANGGTQGTGLGMAITKNLVDLMGGTIEIESELDKGSTFTVELTFSLPSAEKDDEFWKRKGIMRILVADDDEHVCTEIKDTLGEVGVDVTCAANGEEAVNAAVEAFNESKNFNIILLDWKMPVMNGVEAAIKIRETIKADVPILVLSSYDWSDIEDKAREAGIDAFLPKPFFISSFRQTIEALDNAPAAIVSDEEYKDVLKGIHFLVAEDNELNAEILSELLDIEEATLDIASNGKEAVEIFSSSPENKYDMILMDVQMPIMNGYEATKAIRACAHPRAATIPIIAMTANAFAEDVRNALDAGMNAHLSKPVDMKAVKTLIAKIKNSSSKEE